MPVEPPFHTYREQLWSLYRGLALWDPNPGGFYDRVSIGDVGYVSEGAFIRMFNVRLPWDDQSNRTFGIPDRYEPLDFGHLIIRHESFEEVDHYSRCVSRDENANNVQAAIPEQADGVAYSCRGRGALLSLPRGGRRENAVQMKIFEKYIQDNVVSWFIWAQKYQLGVERMEDLILVSGCTLVTTWAAAVFTDHTMHAEISLANKTLRNGGASFVWSNVRGPIVHQHNRFDPQNSPTTPDQCVFIKGFRAKRVLFRIKPIRAAAEPLPDDSDNRGDGDIHVTPVPGVPKYHDPLIGVLDYITAKCIEGPIAEDIIAITHDDDLHFIKNTKTLTADEIEKHLQEISMPLLVENGAAILRVPRNTLDQAPSKLRARAASDSRTLTAANSVSPVGSTLQASNTSGASAQSITATQALTATSPLNFLKSLSLSQTNRVESLTNSPPPTEPSPRPRLSRTSSDLSRQASAAPSSGSPSSSESSTRTLTIPSIPLSTSHTVSASGTDSSNTHSSPSVSATASTVRSLRALLSASGNTRRTNNERTTRKDKTKDSTWPARSASKRSSSLPVQSHKSPESPPYASPSSFSASTTAPTVPSISTSAYPQPPPSRVVVPVPPKPANIFALQTENADLRSEIADLRSEIASLREQLENAGLQAQRREREIRGLRRVVINWGCDKNDTLGSTTTTERRPSGDNAEYREEVQAAARYLRAESESGYGSGSASASHSRLSHSSTYSSAYLAESVSDGSNSEDGITQPGPSARASKDNALDAIPERTVAGGEDTAAAEAERRQKRYERRGSRALKRRSLSTTSDATGSGLVRRHPTSDATGSGLDRRHPTLPAAA